MFVIIFFIFFINSKYDFHIDAERREKCKEVSASMDKKCSARYLFRINNCRLFVGYGHENSTTVLDFLHQICMTLAV